MASDIVGDIPENLIKGGRCRLNRQVKMGWVSGKTIDRSEESTAPDERTIRGPGGSGDLQQEHAGARRSTDAGEESVVSRGIDPTYRDAGFRTLSALPRFKAAPDLFNIHCSSNSWFQ